MIQPVKPAIPLKPATPLNPDYPDDDDRALVRFGLASSQAAGVAPGVVALHVEAARQVLHEHQQALRQKTEIVPSSTTHPGQHHQLVMQVDGDARTIFELNFALDAKEAQLGIEKTPAFDIVFSGS